MPKVVGLTPKEKRFVELYLIDLNGTQAAIKAGYSEKTAYAMANKLGRRPRVKAAIVEAMEQRSARTQIDQDYVLTTIKETVERCRQAAVARDKQGNPVMVEGPKGEIGALYGFDAAGVLKGAELLGRHLKMFTDKINLNVGKSHEDWLGDVAEQLAAEGKLPRVVN